MQTFARSIRYDNGDYKMTLDGRLIGYARSYHEAETTLNEVVHEMLTHGDCATAAELDAPIEDAPVQLASWSTATASAVPPGTPPGDDLPDDIPPNPAPKRFDAPAALALQTLLATQQQGLCLNCGEKHRTWQCSEIAARLFAPEPWKDVALGRELCRMRWRNFNGFVTLLRSVRDHGHLLDYAASYQAFIRDHSPDSTMTIDQVVQVWGRIIRDDSARQQAVA